MGALTARQQVKTHNAAVLGAHFTPQLIATLAGALPGDQYLRRVRRTLGIFVFIRQQLQQMRGAHRLHFAIFFVAHQHHIDGRIGLTLLQGILHPYQVGRRHGFHIGSAAAPQVVAVQARLELTIIRLRLDHIEMSRQHHRGAQLAGKTDQQGRVFPLLEIAHFQAAIAGVIEDKRGSPAHLFEALLRTGCNRRDADQRLGQIKHFAGFVRVGHFHQRLWARPETHRRLRIVMGFPASTLQVLAQPGGIAGLRQVGFGYFFYIPLHLGLALF